LNLIWWVSLSLYPPYQKTFKVSIPQLETGAGLKKLVLMALNAALIIMQLVGDRDGKAGKSGDLVFSSAELVNV